MLSLPNVYFMLAFSLLQRGSKKLTLSKVLPEYHNLKEAFNKHRATALPPHRPYSCAIDLLPGTSPLQGRLYTLSRAENEAIQNYDNDTYKAGLIHPTSSPAGAG